MEYTPNAAATRTTTPATAPAVTPSLCFFAISTAELLVVVPGVCPDTGVGGTGVADIAADEPDDADPEAASWELDREPPPLAPSCATATVPELDPKLTAGRWRDSVARFNRLRSARISAAPW